MKFRFFEFEDFSWFPNSIRESMTDYLRFLFTATSLYKPVVPLIREALMNTNTNVIIDLCSGSGGPMEELLNEYTSVYEDDIQIILTDKFPNTAAYTLIKCKTNGKIVFEKDPIDAVSVPEKLKGFRTIFSGFHHFEKKNARAVLKNAIDAKQGIGIFDGGDKNIFIILAIIIFHPIIFFFCTPFIKPFRFSRIFFTYLIPIIPFCTIWDGVVSIIRLYNPGEMLEMAKAIEPVNYKWKAGKVKNRFGMNIAFLIGTPL